MSNSIADLKIQVDSSQIEAATKKLNEFIEASKGLGDGPLSKPLPAPQVPTPKPAPRPKPPKENDDDKAYQQWFVAAEKRDKKEREMQLSRNAILAREVKDVTAAADARVKAENKALAQKAKDQEKADREELKRYNAVRKDQDKANKELYKQEAALVAERQQFIANSQATLKSRQDQLTREQVKAEKAAVAERTKAEKAAQKELEDLDKQRTRSTIQRNKEIAQEEKKRLKEQTDAERKAASELNRLRAEFDPSHTELKRIGSSQALLDSNRGNMTEAEYGRMNRNLDQARKKAELYGDSLGRTALSAKQLKQAQMGLPAQFTDIVVSLQGGQAPLTVFLQQGGQIKDMFGGVGSAIKGVTQAIRPMINPVTMAAAALGILAVAYNQGAKEGDAYRLSLVSTGNAAGTTVTALAGMAETVDGMVGTNRQAAAVLAQLASSNGITADSFVNLTAAAITWEKASGQAASETVKQFSALGKDPLTAAKRLNEETNFLTASVYQQAAALVQQGREQEAATLLQNEYADTIERRGQELIDKQGWIESGWRNIKEAASEAWDAMLDIGRPDTLDDKLDKALEKGRAKQRGLALGGGFGINIMTPPTPPLKKGELSDWQQVWQDYQNDTETARKDMFKAEGVKQATKDFDDFRKGLVDNASKADKLTSAMDKLDKKVKFMRKNGFIISDSDVKKAQEQLKEKYKESGGRKSADLDNTDVNELGNKINEIKSKYKTLDDAIKQQQDAGTISVQAGVEKRKALLTSETEQLKATYEQQIAALEKLKKTKGISANQTISLDRQIADARSKMVVAVEDAERKQAKLAEDEVKRLRKQKEAVDAYRRSLQQMLEDKKRAGERDREGIGQTSSERALSGEMNAEDDRYTNRVRDLNQQKAERPQDADAINQQLQDEALYHTKMKDQIVNNYKLMKDAQADWTLGVQSAFKQYIEDGQNMAQLANQAVTGAFSSMEDALVSFVTTGKASFSDMTKSILGNLAKIAMQIALSRALSAMFMAWGGPSAPAAASMNSASGMGGVMAAKGAAYNQGTQFFAKGGAFTNSIVSKPTAFGSATSNNNIMGEAGPEAIMPLTRSADGSLGVRAQVDVSGLQQNSGGGVQVFITIDGQGNQTTSQSDPGMGSFGKDVGQFVDQRYKQLISKDLQPGGDIWKSMQG